MALSALGAAACFGQTTAQRPQAAAGAAVGKATAPASVKLPTKTPRQAAEQLTAILAKQKTPHQVYANYARIFAGYAAREAAVSGGGQPAEAARKRLVEHFEGMAALLTAMGEQARVRDEIRRGGSKLPLEQRQPAFAQAGTEHARLLAEFARLAAALPQAKTPTPPGSR